MPAIARGGTSEFSVFFSSPDTDRILRMLGVLGVFGAYSTSRIFPDLEYGPNFPYFTCSLAYLPPLWVRGRASKRGRARGRARAETYPASAGALRNPPEFQFFTWSHVENNQMW